MKIKNSTLRIQNSHTRGMAMLVVLFMTMAVAVIGAGILYRADMAMAGGQNYAHRTQADYLAWAGLEHARALIAADPNTAGQSLTDAPFTLDNAFFYTLEIVPGDLYAYTVASESFYQKDSRRTAGSKLAATVIYDPNEHTTRLVEIQRYP